MRAAGTLLLTRRDIASLLSLENCIDAVERVFKLYGEGKTQPPGIMGVHAASGAFHIKAGLLDLKRPYFAAKINANFPQNPARFGLPLIQGVIALYDAESGFPLALMDSTEITILRTGAATAVAAKYLAKPNSTAVTICGCGNQGAVSLRALRAAFSLNQIFAYDVDHDRARQYGQELSEQLHVKVEAIQDIGKALSRSDICVTCTPSKRFYLKGEYVHPGTFIAAVGADSEDKQELDPTLLKGNKIVVDILDQCATIGELHHALEKNIVTRSDVHAELGEVVAGIKPGRTSSEEITIFDSTGMALQDVVSAATAYERAVQIGMGVPLNFAN